MICNNVTNALRAWCLAATDRYSRECQQERLDTGISLRFISSAVTAELHYKLGTLIDQDFPCYPAYLTAVADLMQIHIDFTLTKPLDPAESHYVRIAENAFWDYLQSLSPDCPAPDVPYCRIIRGSEAKKIARQIRRAWGYDTSCWYPLNGEPASGKFFISTKWIEPHMDEIRRLLGTPPNRIYEYGEEWYDLPHCAEVDQIKTRSSEIAYSPKDFSWLIYFSHENTVTFAGTIVPAIQEILRGEKIP